MAGFDRTTVGRFEVIIEGRMRSRTEYVRREWVTELRRQIVTHKRFKRLVDQWIDQSIERSRLTMRITEPRAT